MKRICLFAGYSPKGKIEKYVLYYINKLLDFADVYYMADSDINNEELKKLAPYTKGAWAYRHEKYDFGSWQELIFNLIPKEILQEYDEFLFVNDSSFGPVFPLKPFFETAAKDSNVKAWGLSAFADDYMGSYFYCIKKEIFFSKYFQNLILSVKHEKDVGDVIRKYEKNLPDVFRKAGTECKVFFFNDDKKTVFNCWRRFIKKRFPLLKLQIFNRSRLYSDREWLPGWRKFISENTDYPTELIDSYIQSIGLPKDYFDTFAFRAKSLWWKIQRGRRNVFRVHFHKNEKILVLFGITFFDNTIEKSKLKIKKF